MALIGLDHVNIRTADLDGLCRFYEDVLWLAQGPPGQTDKSLTTDQDFSVLVVHCGLEAFSF